MNLFESALSFVENIFHTPFSAELPSISAGPPGGIDVTPSVTLDSESAGAGSSWRPESQPSASDAFGTAAGFCQCESESGAIVASFQSTSDTWGSGCGSSSDFGGDF
jgi:hypothetical protein